MYILCSVAREIWFSLRTETRLWISYGNVDTQWIEFFDARITEAISNSRR